MWPRSSARPSTGAPPVTMGIASASEPGSEVEEVFGWVKTAVCGRKLCYCGMERIRFWMEMTTASYNLVRLSKLTALAA